MPIKKVPFDYVHPRKKQVEGSSGKLPQPAQVECMQPKTKSILPTFAVLPIETVSVRLLAPFPKQGVSAEYDAMINDKISRKLATLALLKRGMELFEKQNMERTSYSCETDYVETIRSIERSTYDQFKRNHDPHEIMSARALGKKLGSAILANYFARMKSADAK